MKNLNTSYLLDFYGNLFSEKQRSILEMYFWEDMSLSEIAAVSNMTRQGVYDNIKRGEKEISSLENKLRLKDRFLEISECIDEAEEKLKRADIENGIKADIKDTLNKIKAII